jgi:hypothetical protein
VRLVTWETHPGAHLALIALLVVAGVLGLAALVSLLGVVAPSLQRAADRQARAASPGWATVAGALVAFGVLAVLGWAAKSGETPGAVAALVLGLPAALLTAAGALGTLPLLGERVLGARGASASPLLRHLVGAFVVLFAVGAGAAAQMHVVVLAIVLGWPLGTGLGAAISAVRRRPIAPAA